MKFGKYLERCLKKRDISLNSAANVLGLNRGDLYHIIDGKRKLKQEAFSRLVSSIPFSEEEEKKLIDFYYSDFYGAKEYEKIKYICKRLENVSADSVIVDEQVRPFQKSFALNSEDDILSAVLFLCENSKNQRIITNFSFNSKRLDNLFYKLCCEKKIDHFQHVLSFNAGSNEIHNFDLLFSSIKYIYKKKFPLYYYSELKGENYTPYSYYCLSEDYAVLFNDDSGIFIEDKQVVSSLEKRVDVLLQNCSQLGSEMPDIFGQKDFYVATVMGANQIIEIAPRPCIMSFADLDFFYSICKPEIPNRDFLVHMANEHYANINKQVEYTQFITVEGLDYLFRYRECLEMPPEYANPIPKETLKVIFERMYKAAEEDKVHIVNTKKLNLPIDFQMELVAGGAVIYGYRHTEGKPTEKLFIVNIKDKSMNETFRCFVDYMSRANLIFSKDATLAYLSNRIVALGF